MIVPKMRESWVIHRSGLVCEYPGCGVVFDGDGNSRKYCPKHSCTKYRDKIQIIRKRENLPRPEDVGSYYLKHRFSFVTYIILRCIACDKEMKVLLDHKKHVCPMYCQEHANHYRRKIFVEKNGWLGWDFFERFTGGCGVSFTGNSYRIEVTI